MRTIYGIVVLATFSFGCKKNVQPQRVTSEEWIPIEVAVVAQQSLQFPVYASGMVLSDQEAKPSFKTGGVIKRIFTEEGASVLKGELLATLNLTEINAQVRQAEEGLDKARRDLLRIQNLYGDSIATLEQLQNATTALRLAEETIEIARFNQSYSEVRSPVNGKVLRILLHSGEIAGPGMPVCVILGTNPGNWTVQAGLSDRDWARLRVGNPADITFDAFPGKTYSGRVKYLSEAMNPQSGTFDASLTLETTPPKLASGLVASVQIFPKAGAPSVVIPIDALVESEGDQGIVYVVRDSQYVQRVVVQVGALYENKVVVQKGLKPGMLVATSGSAFLGHGKRIKIVE